MIIFVRHQSLFAEHFLQRTAGGKGSGSCAAGSLPSLDRVSCCSHPSQPWPKCIPQRMGTSVTHESCVPPLLAERGSPWFRGDAAAPAAGGRGQLQRGAPLGITHGCVPGLHFSAMAKQPALLLFPPEKPSKALTFREGGLCSPCKPALLNLSGDEHPNMKAARIADQFRK